MTRYKITWNCGYGTNQDWVEVDTKKEADHLAYEAAREEFESTASYGSELADPENDPDDPLYVDDDGDEE